MDEINDSYLIAQIELDKSKDEIRELKSKLEDAEDYIVFLQTMHSYRFF